MKTWTGILLVVISAAGFGTLAIFGRYAYADGLDVFTIQFLRFSASAAIMGVMLAARRERLPRGSALLRLVGMGAIGYVGQAFSYFTAIKYASPGLVALLLYLYPVFVAILSALWLRESVTRVKVLALGLAVAGTGLTAGPEGGQWLGIVFALSAAIIYTVYIVVGAQVMKHVSPVQSSTVIFAAAAVSSGLLMTANGPHWPATPTGWVVIAGMVAFATWLPAFAFLAGIDRIGPTNAAMLSTLEPVVTILLAASLLGETLKPISLLGGALILAAVLLVTGSELRGNKEEGNRRKEAGA